MRSNIFNLDWEKFDYKDAAQRKMLAGALQYFLALPDRFTPVRYEKCQAFLNQKKQIREDIVRLQEFATTADFPASVLPVIEKFHIIPYYDNGYEAIFDVRDFSGSGRDGFNIVDVQSGLTFRKILPGEKVKVYQMEGEKATCYFDFYGGALGWHRMLFDDKEWWTIEDNAIQFRNKAYQSRAAVFYALIEAVKLQKSACLPTDDPGCDDCTRVALADANAMNLAAQTIILNCKDKGYGIDPATTTLIVLTPLQLRGRIRRALAVNLQAFTGSEKQVDYKFQQITTTMLTDTGTYWVILPKLKMKAGYRMDLTLFSDFDILSYTDTQAAWMRYGGCIGDLDQLECIDATLSSGLR